MNNMRRQLSLFVPEPERSQLDAIRQKYAPKQQAIIPASVKLTEIVLIEQVNGGTWNALSRYPSDAS